MRILAAVALALLAAFFALPVHADPGPGTWNLLCSGQSNMTRARPSNAIAKLHPEVVGRRFARRSSGHWGQKVSGACFWTAVDVSLRLGGATVYAAQAAYNGSHIDTWMTGGNNFTKIIERVVESGFEPRLVAWWQGEAELRAGGDHVTGYDARLVQLVGEWRDTFGIPDLTFVAVKVPPGIPMFRENQLAMCAEFDQALAAGLDRFGIVNTEELVGGTHPPKSALQAYGRYIGDAALIVYLFG